MKSSQYSVKVGLHLPKLLRFFAEADAHRQDYIAHNDNKYLCVAVKDEHVGEASTPKPELLQLDVASLLKNSSRH